MSCLVLRKLLQAMGEEYKRRRAKFELNEMSLAKRSAFPDSTREAKGQQHKNRTRPNHNFILRTDRHLDHAVPVFAQGAEHLSDRVEREAMRQQGGESTRPRLTTSIHLFVGHWSHRAKG